MTDLASLFIGLRSSNIMKVYVIYEVQPPKKKMPLKHLKINYIQYCASRLCGMNVATAEFTCLV
jgi:hypothetical protein